MKNLKIILALFFAFFAFSCAHKSGHNVKDGHTSQHKTAQSTKEPTEEVEVNTKSNLNIPISNNQRSSTILDGAEIFERYGSAVFMVFTSTGMDGYQGSGFFISNDGLAVSNYHVFKGTTMGYEGIKLPNSDQIYHVEEIIHRDETEDFIIFRVNIKNSNYIPISSTKPRIGEKVYAIGSPYGLENTFSSGEVSQWRDQNLMQISASIDHGSSGGALINEYGEVVGITSGTFMEGSQANLNYAWSIDVIKPYIDVK